MALSIEDGAKHSGKFTVDGEEMDGELTFAGGDTALYVHSPKFFRPDADAEQCVHGRLHDLTCVSLFECLASGAVGSHWSTSGRFHFADIQPHFVLHGRRHLRPDDPIIKEVTFRMSDANAIFQDYDAFASAIYPTQEQIRSLTRAMAKVAKRTIKIGARPEIAYFSGKKEIFRVKTPLGTVFSSHSPTVDRGTSEGVSIKNHIWTGIRFDKPMAFSAAIEAMSPILQFMQLIAGRKQEVSNVYVTLNVKDRVKRDLSVYWCFPPRRPDVARRSRTPHAVDLPIDAIRERKLFCNVLKEWLGRHATWLPSRARFADGFSHEQSYDTDRLIGAANMFDLLPTSAVPASTKLPSDMLKAYKTSQELFKALPESPERESVLGALGRLRRPNLKRKIHHRAKPVIEALGPRLPQLLDVLDIAVDARNYFVHGTSTKLDFAGRLSPSLHFLTDALEFVFAMSDLHEAGWPIQNLTRKRSTQSHPFGLFFTTYRLELEQLKSTVPSSHRINN